MNTHISSTQTKIFVTQGVLMTKTGRLLNEKGIPALFFLTKGRSGDGHNIFDTPDKLPLYGYEGLFNLVIDLTGELLEQEMD
jgi:hypothetical protein